MKKLSIILTVLLISLVSHAQETVGKFRTSYFGKEYSIEATQKNNKLDKIFIGLEAKISESAYLVVYGDDLDLFKSALEQVRDKYCDWIKIARDNNVTELDKEFGIQFPSVSVAWLGSKWWFAFEQTIKMRFLILDNGKMLALWVPKVTSSTNEYIDETVYFVFENVGDFNNLIAQLNYQSILDQLLNTKNNEDLFQ